MPRSSVTMVQDRYMLGCRGDLAELVLGKPFKGDEVQATWYCLGRQGMS